MRRSSRIPGFYKLTPEERVGLVQEFASLSDEEARILLEAQAITLPQADKMIENVVGVYSLPLGIAVNFLINGRDYLIPMAIEEASVVAAASHAARLVRQGGGFHAEATDPLMIAQIQVVGMDDLVGAQQRILAAHQRILELANREHPTLTQLGGGARGLEVRLLQETKAGPMLIVHLYVDVRDAMGANVVDSMAESVAPLIQEVSGGRVRLRILSNLADRRLARARCLVPAAALAGEGLNGEDVVQGIVEASAFAEADPYRAATHNKGIMNGVDAVVMATGNDWRAMEAGAHAYAARSGRYTPLARWEKNHAGDLVGYIELPVQVGIVGGLTKVHAVARVALKILGVQSARELSEVIASVGLAQNLAALRALATEGIQKGHMALHARNVAAAAGAPDGLIERIAAIMVQERRIRVERARELLAELTAPVSASSPAG
jgi:hydroxymethylglutaryl-CoA reductase